MSLYERVKAFMFRFGQLDHLRVVEPEGQNYACRYIAVPGAPSDEVVRNRCRWLIEEAFELLEASFQPVGPMATRLDCQRENALAFIEECQPDVDLVAYADANADIRYVAYGNDIAAGIYSPDIDAEVCRSNDTKSPPGADGKVRKGDGYSPPDIAGVLKEQGWKP